MADNIVISETHNLVASHTNSTLTFSYADNKLKCSVATRNGREFSGTVVADDLLDAGELTNLKAYLDTLASNMLQTQHDGIVQ